MSKSLIKINKWLYPASWIYGAGVWLRNKLFDWGYYKERSFNLPIICIGNLTVGGTGKTPHTEYLVKLLQKNYQVAVLSRGYKRKSKGFVLAKENTSVHQVIFLKQILKLILIPRELHSHRCIAENRQNCSMKCIRYHKL